MSWDPYVASLVEGGFHHGCIAGHNGVVWGATPSFKVLPKEILRLASALNDEDGAKDTIRSKGFTIQGRGFALVRLDEQEDDVAYAVGRCKQHGSAVRGVIVARTPQTIIVGVHDPIFAEGISFGKSKIAISQLAENLVSMNF